MPLTIRELPTTERPRERLRTLGAQALSSGELIAILLGSGSKGRSALGIGQEILATCRGSLRLLAAQPVATLTSVAGVGTARAVGIHAALELGRRMASEERQEGAPVQWPRDVYELFGQKLEDLPVEEFTSRCSIPSTGWSATSLLPGASSTHLLCTRVKSFGKRLPSARRR